MTNKLKIQENENIYNYKSTSNITLTFCFTSSFSQTADTSATKFDTAITSVYNQTSKWVGITEPTEYYILDKTFSL